jgi:hypothetical protein
MGSSHPEGHDVLKSNGKEDVEDQLVKLGDKLHGLSKVVAYKLRVQSKPATKWREKAGAPISMAGLSRMLEPTIGRSGSLVHGDAL